MKKIGEVSDVDVTFKYEWKIPNFSSFNETDSKYRSPDFHVSNSAWYIAMYPNGDAAENSTGYVSLYLFRGSSTQPIYINFSFGIKAATENIVNLMKGGFSFNANAWGWPKFIKKSELLQKKSEMLHLDTLTIICSIEVNNKVPNICSSHNKLAEDIKNLFTCNENTDVTLKVKERNFSGHKVILTARSPVFAAMFKNEMDEKKTGVMNIPDCDEAAFKEFLHFLYSGEVVFSNINIYELYKISDKYGVLELKLICIDFLIRILSVNNFCEIIILSDQFDDSQLMTHAQSYFNRNFEKIVATESWKFLLKEKPCLVNNLLTAMAPKVRVME